MTPSDHRARIPEPILPIPAPAPARTLLFAVPRAGRTWPGAARAAAAVAVPALLGVAAGAGSVAAVATLGAFAVAYGEGRPYRTRWRVVAVVGVALVVLAVIGAVAGTIVFRAIAAGGSPSWQMVVVLAMTVTVAVCAFVVDALRLGAPGAFLLLFGLEIAAVLPIAGVTVVQVAMWTSIGAVSALAVAMSGALVRPRTAERTAVAAALRAVDAVAAHDIPATRRTAVHDLHAAWQCLHDARLVGTAHPLVSELGQAHLRCVTVLRGTDHDTAGPEDDLYPQIPLPRPSARYRLARAAHLRGRAVTVVVRLLVACPAAGAVAVATGVGRPDWAVITAAMILHQGPGRILGTYRAVHRFAGTVLGLAFLAVLALLDLHGATLVVAIATLMAGMQMYLSRNYGLAMVFITPLAILLGVLGAPGSLEIVARDRFLETVIGVVAAVGVMWGVWPRAYRRILADADGRVAETMTRIACAEEAREAADLPELRRDLAFDLLESTTAAITAAHTDPVWTSTRWPEHRSLHERGYRILTATRVR